MSAIANNNNNVGAGYIERNGEQYLVERQDRWPTTKANPKYRKWDPQWNSHPYSGTLLKSHKAQICGLARQQLMGKRRS